MRLFLATCLCWFAFAALCIAAEAPPSLAPGFTLMDQNGQFHDLGEHRGKVVLLDIMQTRCPNCQVLSQTLEAIHTQYGDKVTILSVVNPPDNRQSVKAYIAKYKLSTPILFDCGQMAASYIRPDPARPQIHLPHLFLIDAKGMIRKHYIHTDTAVFIGQGLGPEIERLLAEAGGPKE